MPTDENLPVQHANATQNDRAERMPSGEDLLKPGSWWSLCDDAEMVGFPAADIDAAQENANTLRGKQMFGPVPDHGIVLMVKEVRLDDGAPHTIIMHPHPLWGRDGDFPMLVGPFLAAMRHEPDGAAKRALEEAQMMGRIEQITSDMAKPASEEEVMKIVDAKKEAEAKKAEQERARAARSGKPDPNAISHDRMALVPAALLPSRDVADAERVVKDQIMITEARAEIMKSSMNRIQNGMAIISKFQEEKVAVALAGISQQTDFAKSMMSRVHTMKLWLGEGVGVSPLAEGDGAPVDEKIRFMQQLLYL
ncbi:MAG: hypothetical protein ABJK83_00140, partial [Parasphingorhabdus sp.]|uniref:hypothetical protein n=1 Tax=Parasphingorhabdus sp. TaxID=2709688 RepID=UPI0032998B50